MFEAIKRYFQRKESATGGVIFRGSRHAQWMKRNYRAFAEEGYQKNNVANAAINKIASAVGSAVFVAKARNGDEIENHSILDLLARPNPMQSGSQFLKAVTGFYLVAGNAYIERTVAGGRPRELWPLRSDRMHVVPSESGMPRGYVYKVGQDTVAWDADPRTGQSDIRHIKAWNPLDDWYGLSPIEAGAYAVDQHNEGMKWLQGLLQNSAAPSGVLHTSGEFSDEQFNRLKAEMDEKYSGGQNAGRPMLLEGGLQWQAMGMSPQQMQIIEAKHSSARDVALALGVPPQLIGIPGDSTFANYHEARLAFYEETVIPIMEMIADELNVWLAPLFGDVRLEVDLESIPAIAEKRNRLWEMADRSSDLTINEKRAMKGYESIRGGDAVLVPSALIPLSLASDDGTGANNDRDPVALPVESAPFAGDDKVQDTALNGAQVQSLQSIVAAVAIGDMPRATAIELILVAFPAISREQAEAMLRPLEGFTPAFVNGADEQRARDIAALAYGEASIRAIK